MIFKEPVESSDTSDVESIKAIDPKESFSGLINGFSSFARKKNKIIKDAKLTKPSNVL